jgi:serine/threonine protein kinase
MPAHADPFPQRPDVIDGRYIVEEWLGSGDQKNVYRGRDPKVVRDVAIALAKVDSLDADLDEVTAWEVKILSELGHLHHVVNVFDAGVQDGFAYIVSEYMEGGTFGELCVRARVDGQPLPLEMILMLAGEAAAGLEEIHAHGIVHRDIQPRNIWLDTSPAAPRGLATSTSLSGSTTRRVSSLAR